MDQAVVGIQDQGIAPAVTPSPAQEVQPEKVLKQSEVNELVGRIKHEAYEKGRREAQALVQNVQPQAASTMGGMPQVTDDHVRKLISEEAQKQAHMAEVQKTLSSFAQQMGTGKGKYSDFDETVANLGNLQNIPHVVQMATDTGIASDVMYELGRNPGKVASLTTLAYINPDLAKLEMRKLADSIKANQEASKSPAASEPLSQLKPSTVGTDNGSNTVSDLRRNPKYRA